VFKTAHQTIRDAIKRQSFDSAYYLFGEDDYLKEDAAKQLEDAALDPATRDFNFETRRGAEIDAETLSVLLSTPPMMASRRVVSIYDAGSLKKDARKVLDDYLRNPAPDVMLLLVASGEGKADSALAELTTPLKFDELTGDRLPKWIAHTAKTLYGVEITPGAIELLQSSVGSDLQQLLTELNKLASYAESGTIDESSVAAVVGVTPGETLPDFLDAVADRDAAKALSLVPLILSQPKTSGVSIVMALATQMLAIGWGRAKLDEGTTKARLAQEYFDFLKSSGAFAGRPWGSAATAWTRGAGNWSAAEIDVALEALADADVALKETATSSEDQIVAGLVLAMCATNLPAAA